ncbi:MAG: adhesin [Bacteroidia bacterium]|nr:MAG: adhesin [Bacteroidia bacterium]
MKTSIIWFLLFVVPCALNAQTKLKVVTTLNYLKYIVEEVGGDRVEVIALANPKQDPHYVTPTPRMNEITHGADLFIENGLSLDLWAKNVLDASGNPRIQRGTPGHLVATSNVPLRELPSEISRSWGDIHPQGNPHCWLDPLNVQIIARNIGERLAEIDPHNAARYSEQTTAFVERISSLLFGERLLKTIGPKAGDILTRKVKSGTLFEWLRERNLLGLLDGWMAQAADHWGMKVVSYHKTYVYFASRFGLNIIGELEEKPGIPPPPQRRDAIVEQVVANQVRVILNYNFYSREAADYVASKTGARVVITYIDVGASEEIPTYEALISYLLRHIMNP